VKAAAWGGRGIRERWARLVPPLALGFATAAAAQGPPTPGGEYRLAPDSRLEVLVGRAGPLAALGHRHVIRARRFAGSITYQPDDPVHDRVAVTVATDGLYVVPAADSADIPKITATMRNEVLRVDSFPRITFASSAVIPTPRGIHVEGTLTLVGRSRQVAFDAELYMEGDTLVAAATFAVRQTDFGIRPVRKALGFVRVADELRFQIVLRATREE
jgi:polyisoprenoid-binding protein YceI